MRGKPRTLDGTILGEKIKRKRKSEMGRDVRRRDFDLFGAPALNSLLSYLIGATHMHPTFPRFM